MDPYSLRSRLGEKQFDILNPEDYLAKLRLVADELAAAEDRKVAKEDLLNAHLRLIAKTIRRVLDAARAKGGFTAPHDGVGIDEPSDLFISMAGRVYGELTEMVLVAGDGGARLSGLIAYRVTCRVLDKIKQAATAKRTADFGSAALLESYPDVGEPFDVLESLIVDEAYTELRATAEAMPGKQGLVFQALIYGFETGQDLTIAEIARALGILETTARSAYQAAREKLRLRFPELIPIAGTGRHHDTT